MLKQLLKVNRTYREAKKELIEKSVNSLEARGNPLLAILLLVLTVSLWFLVALSPTGFEKIYNEYGFTPFGFVLVVSYFTFFVGSKLILKPSVDELRDDTSIFALFSACKRKELRSLYSIGLAVLHTAILVLYLIDKDLALFEFR